MLPDTFILSSLSKALLIELLTCFSSVGVKCEALRVMQIWFWPSSLKLLNINQFVHNIIIFDSVTTGMQNKQSMKCFNYAQHLDPMLDIKRGVGDGGYGDPDYSNIDVVSGNCKL